MISHVLQEDTNGCGLACLAMLTGQTYRQVRADFENWGGDGTTEFHITAYLADKGYAWTWLHHGHIYKRELTGPDTWRTRMRDPWPPPLWANVHIASVETGRGSHFIIVLRDGRVLDPATPEPRRWSEYGRCFNIAAVYRGVIEIDVDGEY